MGRPLSTTSASPVGSVEMSREEHVQVANSAQPQGPRTWTTTDADPDDERWWSTKKIFVEAFTAGPLSADRGTLQQPSGRLAAVEASDDRLMKIDEKDEIQIDTDFTKLFPARYTITEEELAGVALDTVEDDGDDEFELAWDEESDSGDIMDVDVHNVHSDVSTPAPSTPVAAARVIALPVAVPTTPRRRTLPVSLPSTPIPVGTPIRQNSYHSHTPSMSPVPTPGSMTTRSMARVRGFAVHSPRTELVL